MKKAEYKKLWGNQTLQEALSDAIARSHTGHKYDELKAIVADEENDEGLDQEEIEEVDKAVNLIGHMFEYYGVDRLSKGFAKLDMPSKMYIVGGILHRFTSGMPEGAGLAEVKMENSDWECFLVRKDAGYESEVKALRDASDE